MVSVEVEFRELIGSGDALGRVVDDSSRAGKTVLAPFAAPGERAMVALQAEKKSLAHGSVLEVLRPAAERIEPPCPFFRPATPVQSCGGCSWQHLNAEAQRAAKRRLVVNALERIGGFDCSQIEIEATRGADGFNYRNKADFVLGRDSRTGNAEIGFFAHNSHELVDLDECLIQHPLNEAVLEAAREILRRYPDWAFDPQSGRGAWRRLVTRVSSEGEGLAAIVGTHEQWDQAKKCAEILKEVAPHLKGVIWRGARKSGAKERVLNGQGYLTENVNGLRFRVSGDGFWQVNSQMTPVMAELALEMAEIQPGNNALDLFCGAGLFALHLARAGAQVHGIEWSRQAIEDAHFNAGANHLKASFEAGDAGRALQKLAATKSAGHYDLVLLDPPRSGAQEAMAPLQKLAPKRIVWVSCDVATFARDARILSEKYHIVRIVPLDLFPQTPHVETVALLLRKDV